ncbi:MAG: hypothetical protein CMJ64_09755 [Planctomycetaceae bacterium]|nr:hypothetical protein [Planctomycetaceae bacterium]
MWRFVVLRHEPGPASTRELHWDLMLEDDSDLRTWALVSEPKPDATIVAIELPNHRKDYLVYEGPVSGERGSVTRFDHGTYSLIRESSDEVAIELNGQRLRAAVTLQRCSDDQRWLVAFDDG